MISKQKQAALFSSGLFIGAMTLAVALQLTTISNLNAQLAEQQKQVTGLTSTNQRLQQKMQLIIKNRDPGAFYQQSVDQLPKHNLNNRLIANNPKNYNRG